jgi:hypothetical protein
MATIPAPAIASPAATPPAPFGGFGPRMVSFSSPDAANPTGGQTLDALMARQRALQASQAQPDPTSLASPWLGLSNLVGKVNTAVGLDQSRVQEALGRQQLAQAMNQRDPTTGELTPDAQATVMRLAPTVGEDLYKTSLDRRAQLEQIKAQQTTWADDPNNPNMQISSLGESRVKPMAPRPLTPDEYKQYNLNPIDPYVMTSSGPQYVGAVNQNRATETEVNAATSDIGNNQSTQEHLGKALDLIDQGINVGGMTSLKNVAGNIGLSEVPIIGPDQGRIDRTNQFKQLFNDPGMKAALAAGMSGIPAADVQDFIDKMTSDSVGIKAKQDTINSMRDRLAGIQQNQQRHLKVIKGQPLDSPDLQPQTQAATAAAPVFKGSDAQKQAEIANARAYIAKDPTNNRAKAIQILRTAGIEPPGDL